MTKMTPVTILSLRSGNHYSPTLLPEVLKKLVPHAGNVKRNVMSEKFKSMSDEPYNVVRRSVLCMVEEIAERNRIC
uniref:Uncharacterized protein n=1 Tax=Nelumbo nucifera TaxID=4432 RepID=A0A822YMG2_NELNU|nr:TPA_asm: hypothetical protein HUJ06_011612 [Nelumbo nucifera]DAD32762.1 TPA_asm: hypothetical protein HUJ06_011613 [Nelumbo nucifera]